MKRDEAKQKTRLLHLTAPYTIRAIVDPAFQHSLSLNYAINATLSADQKTKQNALSFLRSKVCLVQAKMHPQMVMVDALL